MIGCLGKMAMGLAIAGGLALGGCALIMGSCTVGLGGIATSVANNIDTDDFVEVFNTGVSRIGSLLLAGPSQLDGTLTRSADGYTGTYEETCHATTGTCALFGGTDLEGRDLTVTYSLEKGSGDITLTLQERGETKLIAHGGESGEQTLHLEAGANYLFLETSNYTGSLSIEVAEVSDH